MFLPSNRPPYSNPSSADAVADPEERFIRVLMYYLSGWHIKPKGVKKPYVRLYFHLGHSTHTSIVTTQCWASSSGVDTTMPMAPMVITLQNRVSLSSRSSLRLSQLELKYAHLGIVSHHPPISAYFYYSPGNHVRISGELKPKVRFLGNSIMTVMEGQNRVYLTKRPGDGGASTPWPDNDGDD
jgi:hypothetical protein